MKISHFGPNKVLNQHWQAIKCPHKNETDLVERFLCRQKKNGQSVLSWR